MPVRGLESSPAVVDIPIPACNRARRESTRGPAGLESILPGCAIEMRLRPGVGCLKGSECIESTQRTVLLSEDPGVGTEPKGGVVSRVLGVIGLVLYLAVGWLYLASGLVVPFPWLVGVWVIWAVGLLVLFRVFRASPRLTPLVPLAAVAVWVVVVQMGSWLLGWTA